jgi:cytochrome c oxidase subunit 1
MSSISTGPSLQEHVSFYKETSGFFSWLWTKDHKRIGIQYMVAITSFFMFAVAMGVLLRLELFSANVNAGGALLKDSDFYNRILTIHGVTMIFLFIIPGIPAIFGNFFLPIMIGADDVAFPKLNLFSWYFYVVGGIFALCTIIFGGVDTGWTFYAPYSAQTEIILPLTAAFTVGWSSILTGINFIVTIHRLRAKNMGFFDMPLFCWALYATSWIQVLATPVIGITLILLLMEKYLGIGIFDPVKGGDPILFQHMFWIYSHPAVYIMIVPAMGVVSEIIPTFCRRTIFGYKFIAFSSIAIAGIGSLVWAHHMFTAGMADQARILFSFLTFLVAVPSAIKVFNWIATMYKGSISLQPPMVFALIFIVLFSIGGFSGLIQGALVTDIHVHDTSFVVAHFHYVMFGGTGVIFFGAILYWFPKMFGRMYNNKIIYWSALLFFIGFNTLYGTMHWMGMKGMPRRYADYLPEYQPLHRMATMGSWIMVAGIVLMMGHLLYSVFKGKKAEDNPWGGATLEWTTQTPPPLLNFVEPPVMTRGAYEYPDEVEK